MKGSEQRNPGPQMWSMWKDLFIPSKPWRMMTPLGVMAFRTKRLATAARDQYLQSVARREAR